MGDVKRGEQKHTLDIKINGNIDWGIHISLFYDCEIIHLAWSSVFFFFFCCSLLHSNSRRKINRRPEE